MLLGCSISVLRKTFDIVLRCNLCEHEVGIANMERERLEKGARGEMNASLDRADRLPLILNNLLINAHTSLTSIASRYRFLKLSSSSTFRKIPK